MSSSARPSWPNSSVPWTGNRVEKSPWATRPATSSSCLTRRAVGRAASHAAAAASTSATSPTSRIRLRITATSPSTSSSGSENATTAPRTGRREPGSRKKSGSAACPSVPPAPGSVPVWIRPVRAAAWATSNCSSIWTSRVESDFRYVSTPRSPALTPNTVTRTFAVSAVSRTSALMRPAGVFESIASRIAGEYERTSSLSVRSFSSRSDDSSVGTTPP